MVRSLHQSQHGHFIPDGNTQKVSARPEVREILQINALT